MNKYFYLHKNGSLIYQTIVDTENPKDYFNSPFVIKYWSFSFKNRADAWVIFLESLALGLIKKEGDRLTKKWHLSMLDFHTYMLTEPDISKNMQEGLYIWGRDYLGKTEEEFWHAMNLIHAGYSERN